MNAATALSINLFQDNLIWLSIVLQNTVTHIISLGLKHSDDELLNINPLSWTYFIYECTKTLEDFNTAG